MMVSIRSLLARWLSRYPSLYKRLQLLYRGSASHRPSLQEQISNRLRTLPSVFFVQVGSNDGRNGDPISHFIQRDRRWAGIFIEPVPHIFERLKTHYGNDSRFIYENVLIGNSREPTKFYFVSDQAKHRLGNALPVWYDQLGSFDRQHIIKHLDGLLEPYIVEVELPCALLKDVLGRNAVARVDLLHVDTEGYDYEVLAQFDFDLYRPAIVLYEHMHLSAEQRDKAQNLLLAKGYVLHLKKADTLAIAPG